MSYLPVQERWLHSPALSPPEDPFLLLTTAERRFSPPPFLTPALEPVREFLTEELSGAEGPLEDAHLLRPSLVLLWAGLGELPKASLTELAAATEMIHHAMLAQRGCLRLQASRNVFGILSNDLVLARALSIYTAHGDLGVMESIASGSIALCEALLEEMQPLPDVRRLVDRLGAYCGACCEVGAGLGRLAPPQIDEARRFGHALVQGALGQPGARHPRVPLARSATQQRSREALLELTTSLAAAPAR